MQVRVLSITTSLAPAGSSNIDLYISTAVDDVLAHVTVSSTAVSEGQCTDSAAVPHTSIIAIQSVRSFPSAAVYCGNHATPMGMRHEATAVL